MKSLKNLSVIQSAKLLHQLFPEEISGFTGYLKDECGKEEIIFSPMWDDDAYTPDELIDARNTVLDIFQQYGYHLDKSRKVFSENLFGTGDILPLVVDRLIMYITTYPHRCIKFSHMVVVLFFDDYYLTRTSLPADIDLPF
ncbi:hypothetical protein ACTJJ0_11075 [Chitinophaga sp. 22321]|uniref:hypothetical protein n=1 Tax=Chitinophaga sp. 22321 TaxID=3453909 RepID=UPI003F87B8EC